MAIAFVQVKSNTSSAAVNTLASTFTNVQAVGNLNVVAISFSDGAVTVTSVVDSLGNTYVLVVGPTRGGTNSNDQYIYYAKNIKAGANTVTVSLSASVTFVDIRMAEYSGIDAVSPLSNFSAGTGTGVLLNSGNATTSQANSLLVGAGTSFGAISSAGAGYTSRIINSFGFALEDQIVSSIGTYSATFNSSNDVWVCQLAEFKAAASGKIIASLNGSASVTIFSSTKGFIQSNTGLAFTDTFNTGSLNPRWVIDTGAAPGTIAGVNTGTFSAGNVDMSQNVLALKVTQTGANPTISTGAEVRSINTFGFGSYEWTMRSSSTATTPNGAGSVTSGQISSGFTFVNNSQTEIDSPEIEGQHPQAIEWTNFSGVANKQTSTTNVAFNPDQGFHSYKFIWQPTQIDFYIDGVHVDFHNLNIPVTAAFILFNHWGTNSASFGGLATAGVTRWLYFNKFSFIPLAAIGSAVVSGILRGATFALANVSWSASSGATSYNVKRANALAGPYLNRGTVNATSFTDYDLFLQGNTYYYEVTALNSAGESGPSSIVSVSIPVSSSNVSGIVGTGTVNSTIKGFGRILSPITGAALENVTLIAKGKILSNITGIGSVTSILKSPGGIISHIFGTASVSGTVKSFGKVISSISGTSSCTVTSNAKGIIAAILSGHSSVTGTGRTVGVLKSNILGTSQVQVSTFVGAMLANIFSSGSIVANLIAAPHLILSNITGHGSVSATIKGLGKTSTAIVGHGTVNSSLIAKGKIVSSITGVGAVNGIFHITGGIISHILGSSVVSVQPNAKGIILSSTIGHSSVSGIIANSSHVASVITGHSVVSGTLKSKSFILSTINGVGSLSIFQYIAINNIEVTANPATPGTWVAMIIRLTNIGNTSMTWAATTDIYWLTATLPSGVLPNFGNTVDIPIIVNMPGPFFPFPEPLVAHVTITANAPGFPRIIEVDVAPIVRINTIGNEPEEWKSPIRFGLGSSLQW